MREKRRSLLWAAVSAVVLVAVLLPFARGARAATAEIDIATAFPDSVFQEYVLENIDKDGNGKLSDEEALAVKKIEVAWGGLQVRIRSLAGVEYFPNLETLDCSENQLSELDLSHNTKLKMLDCSYNALTTLNLGNITTLKYLDCSHNQLLTLNPKQFPKLVTLMCAYNQIMSIDVSACPDLTYLEVQNNRLSALNVSKNTNLTELSCEDNALTVLDLSNNKELDSLSCAFNQLTSLDLSACPRLNAVDCSGNRLTSLDVSNQQNIYTLMCYSNRLTSLQLGRTYLYTLFCGDNRLTSLTTEGHVQLLECAANQIKTLNVDSLAVVCNGNPLQSLKRTLSTSYQTGSCVSVGTNLTLQTPFDSCVSYQWQSKSPTSSEWKNCTAPSATTSRLTFKVQAAHDLYHFRCVMTEENGSQVILSEHEVRTIPVIISEPRWVTATVGSKATFKVVATGTEPLTYQWQAFNPNTRQWVNSSAAGAKTATLSITAQSGHNGFWFRCIVTDANGKTMTSDEVMLTVMKAPAKPVIITQPAAKIVPVGGTAEFTVLAAGAGTLKYQWQAYNPTTKKWVNSSSESAKTAKLSITAQAGHHNFKFRCIVTDGNGKSTTSGEARLTVRPGIVTQPKDVTVSVGGTVKLSVTANSVGTLSYQWQVWDTATSSWKNSVAASAKTANFSFTAQKGHNGKKFRCVLTDSNGNQTVTRGALVTVK